MKATPSKATNRPIPSALFNDLAVQAMLDWDARGRPQGEIGVDADAPALTEAQLREMRPARFRIGKGRKAG